MDKEISGISQNGIVYSTVRSDSEYKITAGEAFSKELINPLKLTDKTLGETIGDMHRKHLHTLLDEWIDNGLKDKNHG